MTSLMPTCCDLIWSQHCFPKIVFFCLFQLSSCHAVLSTQLADAMMFPITQFKERDLKGRGLEQILFFNQQQQQQKHSI